MVKINRGSSLFKKRATSFKKQLRRTARRNYGRRFLKEMGLTTETQSFSRGFSASGRTDFAGFDIASTPAPAAPRTGTSTAALSVALDVPDRAVNRSNPSISTIIEQFNILVDLANRIGAISKEQQQALYNQLLSEQRLSREQIQEAKPASVIPVSADQTGRIGITSVEDIVERLNKRLLDLTETVNEKIEEQESGDSFFDRFLEEMGFDIDDRRKSKRRKEARNRLKRMQATRAAREAATAGTPRRLTPGELQNANRATRNIAGRNVSLTSIKEAIKSAAKPIIARGLGSTLLKSIPIAGAGVGVAFAASRLVKGDVVGAGLDLFSGLGGPMTAVPALVTSVSRDVYTQSFGIEPERDPLVAERMPIVKSAVEELIQDQLKEKIRPKSGAIAPPQTKPVTPTQALQVNAPKVAGNPGSSAVPGGGQNTKPEQTTPSAAMSPKPVATGPQIINASNPPMAPATNALGFNNAAGRFTPQSTPQIAAGRAGIGNVPNPDYVPSGSNNLADLFKIMFFNVNYQEQ